VSRRESYTVSEHNGDVFFGGDVFFWGYVSS
jgi:hypothetical protein